MPARCVRRQTRVPLISIVEATRDAAKALGLARPGLFATTFTIKGGFYQEVFSRAGMTVVVPEEDEQAALHHIYMNELIVGDFRQETRDRPAPEDDDERRRYYRITALGTAVAKAEARRLAQLVKMARAAGFAPGRA